MVILAVTKIIRVKDNVKGCINYVTNKDKTDEGTLERVIAPEPW